MGGDTCHAEAFFDSHKSHETIAERVKLMPKEKGTGIKILTPKNY